LNWQLQNKAESWLMAGSIAVIMLVAGPYFARRSGSDFREYQNDFNVYYYAGREVLAGRDPYQNSLGPWTPYLYPPVLAVLIVPLALLPVQAAAFIWFIVSATSFVLAARLASMLSVCGVASGSDPNRDQTESDREALVGLIAMIVVGRFALDCFAMGQVNAIVASLAVAHVYLYAKGRLRLSAFALALGAAIKLTPAVLIVYHLAKGRISFAIKSSLMLVVLLAASFLVFGPRAAGALRSFGEQTIANGQGFDFGYSGNQSIRALESRLLSQGEESSRRPYDTPSLAISLVLTIVALFAARKRAPEIAAAAPAFCCMVFLSPLAWKSHFIALILPVAYLAARAVKATSGRSRALAVCMITAAFGLFTLTSPTLIGTRAAEWADNHSLVLAGALLIYIAALF
jgi:hypothetical protein